MGLSNWDTLALDENGQTSDGRLLHPEGGAAQFHKNGIRIYAKVADEYPVASVQEGLMNIAGFHILAVRGPQNGIFAVVHYIGHAPNYSTVGMVGCGVYGYEGSDWTGVNKQSLEFFQDWLTNEDNADIPDVFRVLNVSKAPRFNQGDAFFARLAGDTVPTTEPGQAQEPVMTRLLPKR